MPRKKKLSSKLVSGVRQVQLQRKQVDATKSSAQVVDQAAEPMPAIATSVPVTERSASVVTEPVAPRAAQAPERRSNVSHPRRIWPD